MNGVIMIRDFPKVECPFVRKTYKINHTDFKKFGSSLKLRAPEVYLVTSEVAEGFDWVLKDPETFATEKLDGSNLGLEMEEGRLVHLQNRMNVIDPLQILSGRTFLCEGVFNAAAKKYVEKTGIQYGECLGPKLQGNMYELPSHLWYPFDKAKRDLRYTSFSKYEKSFQSWSEWFRLALKSIFFCRFHKIQISDMFGNSEVPFAEGIVFYNDSVIHSEDHPTIPRIAKLRRDMMDWYYGNNVEIYDLEPWRVEQAKACGYSLKGYV